MESKQTCKECKEFLIKQYLNSDNKPLPKYDNTQDNKMTFANMKAKYLKN